MSKTSRLSAVFLALVVTLTSLLAFYTAPNRAMAEGITGDWKAGEEGTTFVIGGVEYAVDTSDATYSGKRIEYPASSGTYYYLIENATDFATLTDGTERTSINKRAILTADITLNDRGGTAQNCYGILLEGNNKTVSFTGNCNRGMFHNFSGIVRNLTITGTVAFTATNTNSNGIGAVCAYGKGIELENVTSSVTISLTQDTTAETFLGGLVGSIRATKLENALSDNNFVAILKNCTVSGSTTVTCVNSYAGAIAGDIRCAAKLTNCVNTGSVTEIASSQSASKGARGIGGLAGTITSDATTVQFINCTNGSSENNALGAVTAKHKSCGGLVGYNASTALSFENCKNYGALDNTDSSNRTGGFLGYTGTSVSLTDCTNYGSVTTSGNMGAGIVGIINGGSSSTLLRCTNAGVITNTSAQNTGGLVAQAGGTAVTFTNCSNTGNINGTGSSTGSMVGYSGANLTISGCTNSGTIKSVNSTVGGIIGKCNGNITMSGTTNSGTVYTQSTGSNAEAASAGGLVGCVRANKTQNFTNCVNNGTVSCSTRSGYAGGLLGSIADAGATMTFTNCTNNGNVSSTGNLPSGVTAGVLGGIVGGSYGSATSNPISITITGSANTGTVTANGTVLNYVGGFVGYLGQGSAASQITVENSTSSEAITNASTAGKTGGFIGYTNKNYTVRNSYSAGVLTGSALYAVAFADGEVTATVSGAVANSTNDPDATVGAAKSPAAFAAGEVAYLLNTAKGSAYWYQTIGTDALPVANNEHSVVYQVDLKVGEATVGKTYSNTDAAVAVVLTTEAAYRSEEPAGIRWTTSLDTYQAEVLAASGLNYTLGTLISPKAFVDAAGGLTKAQLSAWLSGFGKDDLSLVAFDLEATDWYNGSVGQFAGSLVNVKESNRDLQFCGVGYLAVGGEILYAVPVVAVYSVLAGI